MGIFRLRPESNASFRHSSIQLLSRHAPIAPAAVEHVTGHYAGIFLTLPSVHAVAKGDGMGGGSENKGMHVVANHALDRHGAGRCGERKLADVSLHSLRNPRLTRIPKSRARLGWTPLSFYWQTREPMLEELNGFWTVLHC